MADGGNPGGVRRLPVRQRETGCPLPSQRQRAALQGRGARPEPRGSLARAPSSCQGSLAALGGGATLDSGSFVAHLEVSAPGGCRTPFVSPGGWRKPGGASSGE